ncbi:FAD-dependent oxidoreductase [Rhodoferax sp. GW822-FHT02A01]|uniref:GcvT family protein n=1 Tax=Rhodoferax sp. GW822-FHT02A01 TaxID=3141537 RepID=UPI00315D0E76
MTEHVRVVVIGGGVVGCSCLYHLAKLGLKDALLLERDELTSGSTWHAAGNLPTFSTSWSILKLQKYSAALYRELASNPADPINYHLTGSVRLAHGRNRMDEFRHVQSMARANGLEYEILSPTELKERYPLIETHDLQGALWDPLDGDIDPSQLTQALAREARTLGATIRRHTRVTALRQKPGGEWVVTTDKGEITAEIVVNAAGYRAGEVMAMVGRHLPIAVMSHQYLVTEDAEELLERGAARLPLLRDPDTSYYLRQERNGFILGPYEWKATPMWLDGMPDDFANQLWNDDFERLESYIEDAMARVPALARAGIKRGVNGPIPYSPDGNPYIGPEPGLRNFFHCNTFSFGITQGGGAGKALAEWVVHGQPEWDLWSLDRRRYGDYATTAYTVAKAVEVYQNEYASSFPYEERLAGRPLRTSPTYDTLKAKGARFGARGGWERAVYFDLRGGLPAEEVLSFRRESIWHGVVAEEVAAVRERVGVLDLPGFTKYELQGPGAAAHLDRLTCSRLPSLGRVSLAYALTSGGKLWSEFTVTRVAEDHFYIISAAIAATHDMDLLRQGLDAGSTVSVRDVSSERGTLIIAGPRSRELLTHITTADLSNAAFPWLSARTVDTVVGPVFAMRVNYVGELGWELHAPVVQMQALYDAVWQAGQAYGLRDFGLYAMDSLRVDKCYRGWKSDLESGYTPLEASLDRFVDLGKPDFVGREALLAEHARGPAYRFVPLIFDEDGDAEAPYCSQVFHGKDNVGLTTSGVWSHTLQKSVALAYIRTPLAQPGTRVQVEVLGQLRAAKVHAEPLYDPRNARLRA